jgi:Tol biopolymer transport system component
MDVGTRPGTVMGTMGYMSPEQVRGKAVDARSDIFSFGTVLYEMLAGRKAFLRESAADTTSAILKEDPPALAGTGSEIPPGLQSIVEHCLEKNPAERFQSARDLAFHLEAVGTGSSSSSQNGVPAGIDSDGSQRGLRPVLLVLAGLVAGVVIGAALTVQLWIPDVPEPPTIRFLSYSGRDSAPSASADGRLIAYVSVHQGRSQIWLKQFPGGDEVALTEGPDDRSPRISPDGSQVLFTRYKGVNSSLHKIPVVGGESRKIVDDGYSGDWSPDGDRTAFLRDRTEGDALTVALWSVSATGQDLREIASVDQSRLTYPRWSPDGKTIVAVLAGIENVANSLLLVTVDDGEMRTVAPPPPGGRLSSPVWVGEGTSVMYAQTGSFASSSAEEGAGRLILHDLDSGRAEVKMWHPSTVEVIDVIGEGSVVLGTSARRQNLMEVTLAEGGTSSAKRWITRGNSVDRQPVFSRDGKWMLFSSNRGGDLDLWKMEVESGAMRRITEDDADDWDPAFSPDGASILWSSNRSGHFEIWICAADGTGARQLTQDGFDAENPTVTPDGQWVVYNSGNPKAPGIWKIHPDGTEATRIIPGTWSTPDISPDGRHVAFRTGGEQRRLFVARVEDGEIAMPPIDLPGTTFNARPRWMPGGNRFLYTASDETGAQGVYIQDFVPGRNTVATRRTLLEFVLEEAPESFAVSPDGDHVIYSVADTLESLMLAQGLAGVEPARRSGR